MSEQLLRYFNRHFHADVARTDTDQQAAYRLRYQVYCDERQYEDSQRYPDGQETTGTTPGRSRCWSGIGPAARRSGSCG